MDRDSLDNDYERNPDDERIVDLADDTDPGSPAPTLDAEERVEDSDDEEAPFDDDPDAGSTD